MAKQTIITQGDYGILFNVQILDSSKAPITIGTDKVKFYVVTPNKQKINVDDVSIIDESKGIVEFEINSEHTQTVGNHEVYVEISSPLFEITSNIGENYYVMAEHGGV